MKSPKLAPVASPVCDLGFRLLVLLAVLSMCLLRGSIATSEDVSDTMEISFKPRDCADVFANGQRESDVYTVYAGSLKRQVQVYCDMTTDGGGWTVFQRRQDGSVDFKQDWASYEKGFGDAQGEYWLGNTYLHSMTASRNYELRIDMRQWDNSAAYALYSDFKIASGSICDKYKLISVGTYCGTSGDSLTGHVGYKFSTVDQDNDAYPAGSCAAAYKGAWWYSNCHSSNLNGFYFSGGTHASYADGIEWNAWTGYHYSLKFTEMKIRPADA
jgi:ficolin